jgi:hypothetical protein
MKSPYQAVAASGTDDLAAKLNTIYNEGRSIMHVLSDGENQYTIISVAPEA